MSPQIDTVIPGFESVAIWGRIPDMSGVALATLSGADVFGLAASAIVVVYLLYALLRGEKF